MIEGIEYAEAEVDFFDDLVRGVDARRAEIDAAITARLASGWSLERLDKPMRQILRAGTYELIARIDVPTGSVISEYVDVADAFYAKREKGFVNGLLDAVDEEVRRITDECYAEARRLLRDNRDRLDAIVAEMLARESLDEPEIYAAAGLPRSLDRPSPDPVPA